jgi:hypothetical protein
MHVELKRRKKKKKKLNVYAREVQHGVVLHPVSIYEQHCGLASKSTSSNFFLEISDPCQGCGLGWSVMKRTFGYQNMKSRSRIARSAELRDGDELGKRHSGVLFAG